MLGSFPSNGMTLINFEIIRFKRNKDLRLIALKRRIPHWHHKDQRV